MNEKSQILPKKRFTIREIRTPHRALKDVLSSYRDTFRDLYPNIFPHGFPR